MSIAHLLEDFSLPFEGVPQVTLTEDDIEDQRLASFEQGYSAGWEDAVKAQDQETHRISATLGSNLEDLSFTYHEALSHMNECLAPLMKAVVDQVLPEAMSATFGLHLADELSDMAREQVDQPVFLIVSPGEKEAVESILNPDGSLPVLVRADPLLGVGQAHIRVGEVEREIDCGSMVDSLRQAVETFTFHNEKERQHG
ncbi:MAG: ABC transporter ATP-binding protein [Rhodobacteraceae bacterium]|nr:ABC transporter ATP-binding protein [Paracoccaceae bacterium]